MRKFPNHAVVATTLRNAKTATRNDWGAICYADGAFLSRRRCARDLEIYDRVGGGDSFASGLIYGLLYGKVAAVGGRVRRGTRRAGHDHSRRHHHGNFAGSSYGDEITDCAH